MAVISDAHKPVKDYDMLAFYSNWNRNSKFFIKDTSSYHRVDDVPWKRDINKVIE